MQFYGKDGNPIYKSPIGLYEIIKGIDHLRMNYTLDEIDAMGINHIGFFHLTDEAEPSYYYRFDNE